MNQKPPQKEGNPIEHAEQLVRDRVPELMELSFGCEDDEYQNSKCDCGLHEALTHPNNK